MAPSHLMETSIKAVCMSTAKRWDQYAWTGPSGCAKDVFEATADAAFANEEGRKSAEGYTFKLFGGLIDWAAKKQATVSTSTTQR
jgi:hypothetical protein